MFICHPPPIWSKMTISYDISWYISKDHIFKKQFLGQNVWPVAIKIWKTIENVSRYRPKDNIFQILCSWVDGQKIPEKRQKIPKKGHIMVKNQNFEKLLKICLDIDLKIIFSKHYVPMPKTMYMRWKIRLFFLIHYKRENLVHAKKTNLYSINTCVSCFPNSSICPKYICHHK